MAKKNSLQKSKSLYTIKKRHSFTSDGTIFENDLVTIAPGLGNYGDEAMLYPDSNFKFRVTTGLGRKKKHVRGDFSKNPDGETDVWKLSDIKDAPVSEESKIVLKPNYTSLRDFAYYGSAVELLKATVRDVMLRFPGGLYDLGKQSPVITVGGTTYRIISNDYNIDCWTNSENISLNTVSRPLKLLSLSYTEYVDADGNNIDKPIINITGTCPESIIGSVKIANRDFYIFMNGEGEKFLLSRGAGSDFQTIIEPKEKYFNEFWDSMDDFERVLLNRDGRVAFRAVFETPYFTEDGYFYTMESYIWPTIGNNGKTPSLSDMAFQNYINSLYSLAEYHDENDTDNLWRMMTHESIKNLDWTYVTDENGKKIENELETKGISAMLRIYGRQFDDIKRYADNIKTTNVVSYDERSNVPDYFLSDVVEIGGIDAINVAPFGKTTFLPEGYILERTASDVNTSFLRRLALNKRYLHSLKGTRRGIEAMLQLFGYVKYDENLTDEETTGTYNISEYVYMVDGEIPKYVEASQIRGHSEYVNTDEDSNLMKNYPVGVMGKDINNPTTWYLVPWHSKNIEYKYPFYFQGKGGWGKLPYKNINLPSLTSVGRLNGNVISLYGESVNYIKFASNIDEMLMFNDKDLFENVICYVSDISDIEERYAPHTINGTTEGDDYSHYFILKNTVLSTICGYVQNHLYDCYGWKNIHLSEYKNEDTITCDGERLIYLETLFSNNIGNNPHVGYGLYDDGEDYLDNFRYLFRGAVSEGLFDYLSTAKDEDNDLGAAVYEKVMNGYGFKLTAKEDNYKCAYFYNADNKNNLILSASSVEDTTLQWNSKKIEDFTFNPDEIEINEATPLEESQSYGIVNVKKLFINFNVGGNIHFIKYIQDVVMKYLELMIPSTTILEYGFDNERGVNYMEAPGVYGLRSRIVTAHAAIGESDNNIVWGEAQEYKVENSNGYDE